MRSPEATIRAAILHPAEEVRCKALNYFSHRLAADTTLMPLVIQAVETCGREKAFSLLRGADRLAQTPETVRWLTAELAKNWPLESVADDNYCFAIALILYRAQTALLDPAVAGLRGFPEELKERFLARLEMASWDWETGWSALEALGREAREHGKFRLKHTRHGELIVESLSRHQDKAEVVLSLLQRRFKGYDRNLMHWLEGFLIDLAGEMRLETTIPALVERMRYGDDWLSDSCVTALPNIGSDAVVSALADQWRRADGEFRRGAAEVMGHIHTDLSVAKLLEFFPREKDPDTREFLAIGLLENFAPQAVELIRAMVLGDELTSDEMDIRYHLIAASTIMGVTFPEYPRWYEEALKDNFGWHDYEPDRIRHNFRDTEGDNERDESDDLEEDDVDEGGLEEEPPLIPFPAQRKSVGRNEPCPCGSGKKYKKCCLPKDEAGDRRLN